MAHQSPLASQQALANRIRKARVRLGHTRGWLDHAARQHAKTRTPATKATLEQAARNFAVADAAHDALLRLGHD